MSTNTTTVHVPADVTATLLEGAGITTEADGTYTLPNGLPRTQGGFFGQHFLWERDEALAWALQAVADDMIDRGAAAGPATTVWVWRDDQGREVSVRYPDISDANEASVAGAELVEVPA